MYNSCRIHASTTDKKDSANQLTTGRTMATTTTPSQSKSRRCPCCAFDLFLPPSEKQRADSSAGDDYDYCNEIDVPPRVQHEGDDDPEETTSDSIGDNNESSRPLDVKDAINALLLEYSSFSQQQNRRPIVIVDTHGHAQLNRERDVTYDVSINQEQKQQQSPSPYSPAITFRVLSLACSVEPDDFQNTLHFAESSNLILPALGVHPWYLASLLVQGDDGNCLDDGNNFPSSNSSLLSTDWLKRLEDLLIEHPLALVGEIGLCKMAKWVRQHPGGKSQAMELQREVFKRQMMLAAQLGRPVSVHVVNQHGVFVSIIRDILESSTESESKSDDCQSCGLPPVIGMHSFTGTAHQVQEVLHLEDQILAKRRKRCCGTTAIDDDDDGDDIKNDKIFYFGFSHTVNYAMVTSEKSRRKGRDAVRAVPLDRIMAESDVHNPRDVLGGTIGAISYLAWAKGTSIAEMMRLTTKNGQEFLRGGTNKMHLY
jgi:TatD DNase family protein